MADVLVCEGQWWGLDFSGEGCAPMDSTDGIYAEEGHGELFSQLSPTDPTEENQRCITVHIHIILSKLSRYSGGLQATILRCDINLSGEANERMLVSESIRKTHSTAYQKDSDQN
ncbi:hypothetical protein P7K49_014083 [Saguinus oedipus]|uniref:Uncharacterized protein n=1 Tax=Saguinus oedipus TaxID=9490 RepID=A0ABQ9VHS0_SAGOE|nr:hypothetical protein P7K49_014083 [Saguinus oedipus]